jgi:uncharacterized FAD-dependent dehydrogenase
MKKYKFDVVIIGTGPSGLACGCAINEKNKKVKNKISFVIIDSGKSLKRRDRFDPFDIVAGLGGAGLFSDGKFSFFPSATHLWKLLNKDILKEAYLWYCKLLSQYKISHSEIPSFEKISSEKKKETTEETKEKCFLKSYPSIYLSLENRYALINEMSDIVDNENIMTETEVINYEKKEKKYVINAKRLCKETKKVEYIEIECDKIVIGCGRMWSLFHKTKTDRFMRLEYGVRIQDKPDRDIFVSTKLKDPKYIFTSFTNLSKKLETYDKTNVEYRTFCCCRRGEVVETDCCGVRTLSGRSDCEPTEESNIGFNVRILEKDIGETIKNELHLKSTFKNVKIKDAIQKNKLELYYGKIGNSYLKIGLELILSKFPDLDNAVLSGPTLEGVGMYPDTDDNLKMNDENIWIIGDACGKFRGITAAAVSGYYVGCIL